MIYPPVPTVGSSLRDQPTAAQATGIPLDSADTRFYVGHETILVHDEATINRIPEAIFSYLNRNAVHDERHYGMPLDQVDSLHAGLLTALPQVVPFLVAQVARWQASGKPAPGLFLAG